MKRIPTILVHGTLGSGKTTLVQTLLRTNEFAGSFVIENEFADVNIDATTLERQGDHIHNTIYSIAGGCICCSSGEELADALRTIVERNWDKPLIIETTGVASSVQLIQKLFLNPDFHEHFEFIKNVYVVDPLETHSEQLLETHTLDVRLADIVLITKADLSEPCALKEITDTVKNISSDVTVIEIVLGVIDPIVFTGGSKVEDRFVEHFNDLSAFQVSDHGVTYVTLIPPVEISSKKVQSVIAELQKDASMEVVRAKGYFSDDKGKWWHLEATRTQLELLPATQKERAVLIIIGKGVEKLTPEIFI